MINQYNVKSYGAKGDWETDDRQAIQDAVDALTEGYKEGRARANLYFPPGVYKTGGPVVVNGEAFAFYRLMVHGAGNGASRIQPINWRTDNVFEFRNVGSLYTSMVTFRDLAFWGGPIALYFDNATYLEIQDCQFKGQNVCLWFQGNTTDVLVSRCWFYHTGNPIWSPDSRAATVDVSACRFGEDCGGFKLRGGLNITGSRFHGSPSDKSERFENPVCWEKGTNGLADMGPSTIAVQHYGRVSLIGNDLGWVDPDAPFITADLPERILMVGNTLHVRNGGSIIKANRLWDYRSAIQMVGNHLRFHGSGGSLLTLHDERQLPNDVIITNNLLRIGRDAVVTADQKLFDPAGRNVVKDNTIVRSHIA